MTQSELEFCFCSLAFGNKYRGLALLLAKDLEKYSPNTSFVVLTDHPDDFSHQLNVLAFKHRQHGVQCYHDKRFVIAKALSMFNCCIYIDADMRILAPVPRDLKWIQEPGITARGCEVLAKKYAKVFAGTANAKVGRELKVTNKAASKLNLHIEEVNFVYEYLFAVTKDSGRELEFLKQWEKLAPYYELHGVFGAEGNAIGLAATEAGLPVRWSEMEGISFFKDRTELIRLQNGQSKIEDVAIYFEQQKMLEHPKRSFWEKVALKLGKSIEQLYKLALLRILTLNNFNFYYR